MSPRKLRVTPEVLYVLLSLTEGPRHGYAVLDDVSRRSRGEATLGPSSLYYTLGRLVDGGLIEEVPAPPDIDEPHGDQRRYFAITSAGRGRLKDELAVLTDIVDQARAMGLRARG